MSERITVGYDGSSASRHALVWAAVEARRRHAGVTVVSCFTSPTIATPWAPAPPFDLEAARVATADHAAAAVEELSPQHPEVAFETKAVYGSPRTELATEATGSSLLVVGSTGAGETESWLLGSVAHAVARSSPCPVVIVPDKAPAPPHQRLVVGFDGSDTATKALEWAADEADRHEAGLVVVYAWDYPYGSELSAPQVHDLMRVDAALVLEEGVDRCRKHCAAPVTGELVQGSPVQTLIDHADRADLVVVGSRGRGGFRSMLFGSVAHAVSRYSPCPVVVVR